MGALVVQSCLLCDPMDCSHQVPPSMGFSRQEYWSGLPCPSPGDLPDPGIEPGFPALQENFLLTELWGKLHPIQLRPFYPDASACDIRGAMWLCVCVCVCMCVCVCWGRVSGMSPDCGENTQTDIIKWLSFSKPNQTIVILMISSFVWE